MSGTATDEEKAWYRGMTQSEEFIKTLSVFGNYAHGTHVAVSVFQIMKKQKFLELS